MYINNKELKKKKLKLKLPSLYPLQLAVFKELINPLSKYLVVNGSRQVGKSVLLTAVAIFLALQKPNQNIMIVSFSDGQVQELHQNILLMIGEAHNVVITRNRVQSGKAEIKFKNNSRLIFRTAGSRNSLRGFSLNHLLIDEAAFIDEDIWDTILSPSLSVRGKDGKVLFCSTPKGANFFKKLYDRGLNNEAGYKSFKITWRDNPYADVEFINERKRVLPEEIYLQEFEGEFVDSGNVFKYVDELSIGKVQQPYGQDCTVGIDIGFKNDFTVAVALSSSGEMLDYIRFNQIDTEEVVERLYQFIQKWRPRKTIIEENNQGISVYHLLRSKAVYNLEAFSTNSKTKGEIINQLIAVFSLRNIKPLNDELVKKELKAYSYSLTKSGNITFAASYGHDDIVMALALANQAKRLGAISKLVFI